MINRNIVNNNKSYENNINDINNNISNSNNSNNNIKKEKEKELLKKVRQYSILNLEIKKLMSELNIDENILNAYINVSNALMEPNKLLYKKLYCSGIEIYYGEYKDIRKNIKWFPKINYDNCNNCYKCIDFCPKGVYDIEYINKSKKVIVKYPFNCIINCNACSYICCENNAIIFPENKISKIEYKKEKR